ENETDHVFAIGGQRTEQPAPGISVVEFGARALDVAVADRRRAVRQGAGVGDLGDRQLHPAGLQVVGREERRRQPPRADRRTAGGWTAEQMSTLTPGYSGSGRVRAPPPAVGWASMTRTDSPARAQMTAADNPLGPLPTIVTSTPISTPHAVRLW